MSSSTAVEAAGRTASIIPFPARPMVELAPQDRLVRALASLNAALADQRTAVAAWRATLAELKTTTSELRGSLERHQTNLQALGKTVSALGDKFRSLENWADRVSASPE